MAPLRRAAFPRVLEGRGPICLKPEVQLRRRDQRTLTEQLLYVEDRIALCTKHIERLNALISEQTVRGGDPAQSRKLLGQITDLLPKNILERDRLQGELGELLK